MLQPPTGGSAKWSRYQEAEVQHAAIAVSCSRSVGILNLAHGNLFGVGRLAYGAGALALLEVRERLALDANGSDTG